MASSRIGGALRTARTRLGWSREALAFHSGVSWSAIAQIESGRRQDVRLSSLSALGDALGVSVDYLIGAKATITPRLLEHRVLAYRSDEEFLATAVPFLAEGIEQSHRLLAVTTPARIGLLRDSLDDRARSVEFAESEDWYRSPREAFDRYLRVVRQSFEEGPAWVRIVAEVVWAGRCEAEITAWTRYESMINLTFASSPVTIVCPYDMRTLSGEVLADAHRTHPALAHGCDAAASPTYQAPEDFLLEPHTVTDLSC